MHAFLGNDISLFPSPKIRRGAGGEVINSPDVLEIHPDTSIGIEEIRSIHTFLSKKPIQNKENTVVVHDAHLMTIPAQNAFLKTLEEPPANSRIYLVTPKPDLLLPTILSRVQLVPDTSHMSYTTNTTYSNLFSQLLSSAVGDRLALIEKQNFTRQSALEFLDQIEIYIHENIKNLPSLHLTPYPLRLISQTRTYLTSNVNLTLALDHFALQLQA
jgi:hypothetical protein